MKTLLLIFTASLFVSAAIALKPEKKSQAFVQKISQELRQKFALKDHYQKVVLLNTFPIVGSELVEDASLLEASQVIASMLKNRPDILRELASNQVRYSVMATSERTCDLPEHSDLTPSAYWNRRARGLGATKERPAVSCGEENLLHHPGDPYNTESICVHEFSHAIHQMALSTLDPTFDQRLKKTYRTAIAQGLWVGKYAGSNHYEYWAEAVQSWFGTNRENDREHNHVNTRQELIDYDPAVARLCEEVFGDNDWQYVRADDPSRANEHHLKNLDRSKLQTFSWTPKELADYEKAQRDR